MTKESQEIETKEKLAGDNVPVDWRPKNKLYWTETELNASVDVVKIKVYGRYSRRGEHRNDVLDDHFEAEIEVPKGYNLGHVKLQAQRYIKRELKGIRVLEFHVDSDYRARKVDGKRKFKDFISDIGLQDNAARKKKAEEAAAKRRQEQALMAEGFAPTEVKDDTYYDADGLPRVVNATFLSQG